MREEDRNLTIERHKKRLTRLLCLFLTLLLSTGFVKAEPSFEVFDSNFVSQQRVKSYQLPTLQQIPGTESTDEKGIVEAPRIKPQESMIERMIAGDINGAGSEKLTQFGYDIFQKPVSTFAPVTNVPVGPDYVVGPGDAFTVTLWGRVNAQYIVEIDRNGQIALPEVGMLNVSGMTMAAMQDYLQDQLSRKQTDFKMAVTMGRIRTIKIFVVGEVDTPGSYTLSSLSTVINSLFAAGGPSKNGTLRDVRVLRNNQKTVHIDIYKFLLGGDKSEDIRLQDGDTVFVPIIGPVVGIGGNVRRPAIYEMSKPITLPEALELAGGVNYAGWMRQVQLERIENHQKRIIVDFNVAEPAAVSSKHGADTIILDGDIIRVFGVSPIEQDKRSASISGEVYRPGEYRFTQGMRLSDLIRAADGPQKNAYLKIAELTRRHISQDGMDTEKINVNLEKILAKDVSEDIELKDYDHLIVRTIPELEFDRVVTISGQVRFPGKYPVVKGESLSSIIERAGGFTDKAYLRGAVFTRQSAKIVQKQRLDELIDRVEESALTTAGKESSAALDEETIQAQEATLRAKRELLAKLRSTKIDGRVVVKLSEMEKFKGSMYDLELEKGDNLFVPEMPGIINVVGDVYNQTSLLYEKDKTVAYYLQKVGGPNRDADKKHINVIKADGSVVSISQDNPDSVYWDSESHQWNFGGFMNIRLNPGDTIVVPRKLDQFLWLKTTKDLTQILFQTALAAGVIIAL